MFTIGQSSVADDTLLLGYLVVFAAAAVVCFTSIVRARQIEDSDTRRGLIGLLLTSGGWASAHVAFLVVPTPQLKTAVYVLGLVIGLSAIGPWLYFCSAYTGRSIHRNPLVRWSALGVFIVIVLVKVTNPFHHLYFTTELVTTPFPHLAVYHGVFHWLVMGLSYALATVGYFMLLELFAQVGYDTKPFVVLVSITGLPIVLDVVGAISTQLIDITYEPIGVAVFAVGVLYVYINRFQAIQLAGRGDDPVLVLSNDNRIRDYNDGAEALFSELADSDALGHSLASVLPLLDDALQSDDSLIKLEREGTERYYRVTETPFGADQTSPGRLLILADITHREQYRRELERQNDRLEQFANMVSHDLRNPLNVAVGRLELAQEELDNDHLEHIADALSRMDSLIEDVLTLARQGQPIDETEPVTLSSVAEECWKWVNTADAELVVESDSRFTADTDRLQQLLENLFRNAIDHGGVITTIRVGALDRGFYVADDGVGIPSADRERIFESGYSTANGGTGFGLAIVNEIVGAHGWDIRVTESSSGGARFEVTGLEVEKWPSQSRSVVTRR